MQMIEWRKRTTMEQLEMDYNLGCYGAMVSYGGYVCIVVYAYNHYEASVYKFLAKDHKNYLITISSILELTSVSKLEFEDSGEGMLWCFKTVNALKRKKK